MTITWHLVHCHWWYVGHLSSPLHSNCSKIKRRKVTNNTINEPNSYSYSYFRVFCLVKDEINLDDLRNLWFGLRIKKQIGNLWLYCLWPWCHTGKINADWLKIVIWFIIFILTGPMFYWLLISYNHDLLSRKICTPWTHHTRPTFQNSSIESLNHA